MNNTQPYGVIGGKQDNKGEEPEVAKENNGSGLAKLALALAVLGLVLSGVAAKLAVDSGKNSLDAIVKLDKKTNKVVAEQAKWNKETTSAVEAKADRSYVDEELVKLAEKSVVDQLRKELGDKANTKDVEALAKTILGKADAKTVARFMRKTNRRLKAIESVVVIPAPSQAAAPAPKAAPPPPPPAPAAPQAPRQAPAI